MKQDPWIVYFELRSEAGRALSQLHAAGVPDGVASVSHDDIEGEPRDEEVGGPDSSASLTGLQGGDAGSDIEHRPGGLVVMRIDPAALNIGREELDTILESAGGRWER